MKERKWREGTFALKGSGWKMLVEGLEEEGLQFEGGERDSYCLSD